jgi:hypothetical protein
LLGDPSPVPETQSPQGSSRIAQGFEHSGNAMDLVEDHEPIFVLS